MSFISSHSLAELIDFTDDSIEIEHITSEVSDESVLTDLELGIHRLHVAKRSSEKPVNDILLSTLLPPFTRLQKLTAANVLNRNSIFGVVASVTDKTVLYSPIPETGVITAVNPSGVTLSFLNANSGILEEDTFPANQISLHKYRLLFYLSNVKQFRGVTGRISCVLIIKFIRELLTCLMYYQQSQHIDVLQQWPTEASTFVRLFQYMYVAYENNSSLSPSQHDHMSLVGCLFRILQNCMIYEVNHSSRGAELLRAFEIGTWDEQIQPYHHSSLSQTSVSSTLSSHGTDVTARTHGCLSFAAVQTDNEYRVHSLHPCLQRTKYCDRVIIPGAAGLRVIFDKRCSLDLDAASLTFFQDEQHTDVIARFTGDASAFCSFTVRGNALRFLYESSYSAKPTWGYAFIVEPFENIRWTGDIEVLQGHCFDWSCFALDLIMDICKDTSDKNRDYFGCVLKNLLLYVRTVGMPFKSTVIRLLTKLLSLRCAGLQRPDVR